MVIWKTEFRSFSADFPVTTINSIAKLPAEIDRNGLEYYSPANFESIDTHLDIVLLGHHMDGFP